MHHHFYFTNPTVSPDGRFGYFVSYRTGYPNLFRIDLASGRLTQFTDRVDINPFSPVPSRSAPQVYLSARSSVRAVNPENGEDRVLATFPGAALGNCSLNVAGTLLAIGLRYSDRCELALIDTATGSCEILTQGSEVGHIQFSPRDDRMLLFSGSSRQRMWIHDRRTGTDRPLYKQAEGEWIVHESWRMGSVDEVIFPHWPRSLRAIRSDGSGLRTIASINVWHACGSPDGWSIVCDTNHPDRGLLLIDARSGEYRALCHSGASQRGTQWAVGTPAAGAGIDTSIIRSSVPENDPPPHPDDPASTYGPQWSHPHPSFTPDGRHVVFTSDRDRWSQVYMVEVPS